MTANLFPIAAFDLIPDDRAATALVTGRHWLGPCNRPFGRQSWGLTLHGELVAEARNSTPRRCGPSSCRRRPDEGRVVRISAARFALLTAPLPVTHACLASLTLREVRAPQAPVPVVQPMTAAEKTPLVPADPYRIRKLARREQTLAELDRLQERVGIWLAKREQADERRQYRTQLRALRTLLSQAAEVLRAAIEQLDPDALREGAFYDQCRAHDLRVLWLRRVWDFFREKFDQRDDVELGPLLRAADEVVWSCHQPVFDGARTWLGSMGQGAAPLPFVEPWYSPEAYPSDLVPDDLRLAGDAVLPASYLNRLPVPVVRLPPICVGSPWWLVYLAHEVGHHVQHDLLENLGLVRLFRERIEDAVRREAGSAVAATWGAWTEEIFADVFSVLMAGPAAVGAMAELEMRNAGDMVQRRPRYPAPVVRLALLADTVGRASRGSLDGRMALRDLQLDQLAAAHATTRDDLALVGLVVGAVLEPLPGLGTSLLNLCGFDAADFAPEGAVEEWALTLQGQADRQPEATVRAPRLVASAAFLAWAEMVGRTTDRPWSERRRELAAATLEQIERNRPEGTREAPAAAALPPLLGHELGEILLRADAARLAAVPPELVVVG